MNRKKVLIVGVALFLIIGIGALSVPFFRSLLPSEKVISTLHRLDLTVVKKGEFKYFPHPVPLKVDNYEWAVLVYRKKDDSIKIWGIPMDNGNVGLPDLQWRKPFYDCKNFGPTLVDGVIDESLPIKCHDVKQLSEWWATEWQWDIDGKSLGSMVDSLHKTKGDLVGNEFVFK